MTPKRHGQLWTYTCRFIDGMHIIMTAFLFVYDEQRETRDGAALNSVSSLFACQVSVTEEISLKRARTLYASL